MSETAGLENSYNIWKEKSTFQQILQRFGAHFYI
jgi:hypothetical protein